MKLILVTLLFFICNGCLYSQQDEPTINTVDKQLANGQVTLSDILSNPVYMSFHSKTAFRELIKKHAKAGKLIMVTEAEPGKKITVKGEIKTRAGIAISDALLYVYHTSDKGWYSDTAAHILQNEGDMNHARLFGYLKTDGDGKFEFITIQPKGYPNSDLPAHIHIAVWKEGDLVEGVPGELLFDEDPRLTPARKRSALNNGYLVEKNTGTLQSPVYNYSIVVRE